ncbi:MAG: nucleotidyl transferase AbiEii/AbiGii toxin family protein [Bacteroidota bacterium]
MKKKPTNISASVLAKLKDIADKDNFDFNFLLVRYIQERFLSRLAVSGHVNKFVLKGGFLLLAYNIEKARPTKDIDFLGINVSRDRKELERLVREIALVDLSDGVRFLPESIRSAIIKENADYEGIRIKLAARFGSAKNAIQIDCGFGDIVSPHPLQMDYPTLLHNEGIKVLAYSKETIVAEKLEAIVKLTTFNTRMKDFFDIVFLSNEFDFDGEALQLAIRNTFARRQTSLKSAEELLDSDFGNRTHFQRHWDAFKRRTRLTTRGVFSEIFKVIQVFIAPIIEAEMEGKSLSLNWDRTTNKWRSKK